MDYIEQDEILRDPRAASLAYVTLNNAGKGFDPEPDLEGWTLLRSAESTDDVSVYEVTDDEGDRWIVLVGTDGSGREPWAVRVGDTGVAVPE